MTNILYLFCRWSWLWQVANKEEVCRLRIKAVQFLFACLLQWYCDPCLTDFCDVHCNVLVLINQISLFVILTKNQDCSHEVVIRSVIPGKYPLYMFRISTPWAKMKSGYGSTNTLFKVQGSGLDWISEMVKTVIICK